MTVRVWIHLFIGVAGVILQYAFFFRFTKEDWAFSTIPAYVVLINTWLFFRSYRRGTL